MRDQGYIHRVQFIQFPLTENDLVSSVYRVSSGISVGTGTGAQGCGGIGRKMNHPQSEKEKDKNKIRETSMFFLGMSNASFFYYNGNDESISIPRSINKEPAMVTSLTRESDLEYIMF